MAASSTDVPLLDKEEAQKIYVWIDAIPLTRPKRNITRDFSDGVLVAEVVHAYFPKLVQLHNYSAANSVKQKMYNWGTLNKKVFKRMGFDIKRHEIEAIVNGVPGMVEVILMRLQARMSEIRAAKRRKGASGGSGSFGGGTSGASAARPGPAGGATVGSMMSPGSMGGSGGRAALAAPAPAAYDGAGPAAMGGMDGGSRAPAGGGADMSLLAEKERRIQELEEMNEFMELKIKKLEQLVQLKDSRIHNLQARLQQMQMGGGGGGPMPAGPSGGR